MRPLDGRASPRQALRAPALVGGVTLIELMVTLSVFSVLIAIAMPSFTTMINSNRLTSQANELVGAVQLARSEALRRNRTVRLCRSEDSATCAADAGEWSAWAVVASGTTPELIKTGSVNGKVEVAGVRSIDFRADGLAYGDGGGLLATTLTVCMPVKSPRENLRRVELAGGARLQITSAEHSVAGACP